ncbi:MAG TPA: GNAT family protein [Candidatus Sulfotelmatobacter sp.]|nr:GNAT family protein [Candidatus Sulfotelmatobacter sp.]
MQTQPVLVGNHVRLEPLERHHAEGLATASAADPALYKWSPVPQGVAEALAYINAALSARDADTAIPFAVIRLSDGAVIGSTRFFNLEYWAWPAGHSLHGRSVPDAGEIGYTWYARSAIRTAVNTESKFLLLRYAFEVWNALRICLHTDARNERSRAAMERMGAKFEGILRAHRMAADFIARDSARYSITASEWPGVKERLKGFLARNP